MYLAFMINHQMTTMVIYPFLEFHNKNFLDAILLSNINVNKLDSIAASESSAKHDVTGGFNKISFLLVV